VFCLDGGRGCFVPLCLGDCSGGDIGCFVLFSFVLVFAVVVMVVLLRFLEVVDDNGAGLLQFKKFFSPSKLCRYLLF
jgi:hypothetical protein